MRSEVAMWLKYQSECIRILVVNIHTLLTLVLDKIINKNNSALVCCIYFDISVLLSFWTWLLSHVPKNYKYEKVNIPETGYFHLQVKGWGRQVLIWEYKIVLFSFSAPKQV
jgi:hypothetical protein